MENDSNVEILPERRKQKKNQVKIQENKLSKCKERKLKQLQEEKEKKAKLAKAFETLQKYKIQEDAYPLLQSSGKIGKVETMKEKRVRAFHFSKAGLETPLYLSASKKIRCEVDSAECYSSDKDSSYNNNASGISPPLTVESVDKDNVFQPMEFRLLSNLTSITHGVSDTNFPDKSSHGKDKSGGIVSNKLKKFPLDSSFCGDEERHLSKDDNNICTTKDSYTTYEAFSSLQMQPKDFVVVHVTRPKDIEIKRRDLPIVMMEQEIMEAIKENSTVIICGETGCGKTTQVPQFLYEAGFASTLSGSQRMMIGITQPRRVAVLATAKRVSLELGLPLGKGVGFQVRYDKKIGENCSIKFMTDGILLRELQSDFLLKQYSVIVLDEAHERSMNTDILIGMLSRVIQIRQRLYLEQQEKMLSGVRVCVENRVIPLKLILMSATLRIEDFSSNKRLFCEPPPLIEIPTRQYPVTIHFSRKTETVDYIGQAYKKTMSIHRNLPPGGILIFVTGQREVEYLCRKLKKATIQLEKPDSKKKSSVEIFSDEPELKDLSDAFDFKDVSSDSESNNFSSMDVDEEFDSDFDVIGDDVDNDDIGDDSGSGKKIEETRIESNVFDKIGSIESLKSAFEALTDKPNNTNSLSTPNSNQCIMNSVCHNKKPSTDKPPVGPLHVLPLYAMLPAAAQLCVFKDVPKGERLVVVATNVAETSLTIPGVKYVVDTGREKVKRYNSKTGMSSYEIQWTSKASAAQRAGRAGRMGPGHCYRLYSSAAFCNAFPDFSPAEISNTPVDGVVLIMKNMGIDKVSNFPFPTPPEATALVEAERCLSAIEAIDNQGCLTQIGHVMTHYPMSPRHSRMLLTVIQMMRNHQSYDRANLVLGYTVAAAAALSFTNPFIMMFDKINAENITDKQEKSMKKKLKETVKVARAKFSNPSSDAFTIAYALQLFELSGNSTEFCRNNALHLKTMEEMSKLRKQLLQLVFHQSRLNHIDQQFIWNHGTLEDVERSWRTPPTKCPLLINEEEILGQAICAGWADRVAKRIQRNSKSTNEDRKISATRYQACSVRETVFLHRRSSVLKAVPEFLVYNELVHSKRPYMHGATCVKPSWLIKYAKSFCSFSAPLSDPKPYYQLLTDQVLSWHSPTFGPHSWQLPLCSLPIKNDSLQVSVFAYSLLIGNILPCLKPFQIYMAAPASIILRPEASGQKRVGELLNKLQAGSKVIASRAALREAWDKNPEFLYTEILCWFQDKFYSHFDNLWMQMHAEANLDVRILSKKMKSRK